jgi:hypothetical protein
MKRRDCSGSSAFDGGPGLRDGMTFNLLFDDGLAELFANAESHKPPQIIIERIIAVLQNPLKLCCWVGEAMPATRTNHPSPGLYASNLFMKLIAAMRALDWEVVLIILEQVAPPKTLFPSVGDQE